MVDESIRKKPRIVIDPAAPVRIATKDCFESLSLIKGQ
jgi:hypothetical protein